MFKKRLAPAATAISLFAAGDVQADHTNQCWSIATFPDSRIGLNFDDLYEPLSVVSTAMDRVRGANVGAVRLWAWWKWMETSEGSIDFSHLDNRVNAAAAKGLDILITFASIPAWANGSSPTCDFWVGGCSAPPTSAVYFGNFAYAVANRYKDQIRHYELLNEADWATFWGGTMSQLNSLIVQPGAVSIQAADPTATILSPSFFSSTTKLKLLLGLSCGAHDVVAIHSYDGSASAMKTAVNGKWTNAMSQAGCVQPIWVTEFGIDSTSVGETVQASQYSAAATSVLDGSLNADRLIFYRLEDHVGGAGWGVTRPPPSYDIKPSYTSLKDAVPLLYCGIVHH